MLTIRLTVRISPGSSMSIFGHEERGVEAAMCLSRSRTEESRSGNSINLFRRKANQRRKAQTRIERPTLTLASMRISEKFSGPVPLKTNTMKGKLLERDEKRLAKGPPIFSPSSQIPVNSSPHFSAYTMRLVLVSCQVNQKREL